MSLQFGELQPTSGSDLLARLGHPGRFQLVSRLGFVTAATSLNGGHQTLHDVWPSPGLVHCVYIFRGSCAIMEFYHVQNSLCVQVLRSPILAALGVRESLWHRIHGMELPNFCRGRHLYSAGWPSRWTSAHILVSLVM